MRLLVLILLCTACEIMGASKHAICRTPQLKNGRVHYLVKRRYAKFKCNIGFILAGDKMNICENGTWDGSPPKCVRSTCIKVQPPPNVIIYPSHRGGVLNFFCKPGFALRGANITYCDGKKWDNRLPTCSEPTKPLPLNCDFENEDLCGWTHDLVHDFDWKRKQSNTPTARSGFATIYDHTKGFGGDGHYMHIESSSNKENETARLISPIYDTVNSSNTCFEFSYFMHGSMSSQLRVYMKKISDSWNLDPNEAFFWKIGNHGNKWLNSWHDLGRIDEDFQIIIECIRGKSFFSDIAIDDVRVVSDCSESFTTESDVSYSFDDYSVPSCSNRCNVPSNSSENLCDCEESCIDNNTCCVDYIAVCVLGVTEEYESTSDYDSLWTTTEEAKTSTLGILKTIENTTTRKTTTTRTTPKFITTTTKRLMRTTTKPATTTTKRSTRTTTKFTTTTKRLTTTTTTKRPTTTTTTKRPTTTTTTTPSTKSTTTTKPAPARKLTPKTTQATEAKKILSSTTTTTTTRLNLLDDIVTIPSIPNDVESNEIITFNTIAPLKKISNDDESNSLRNTIIISSFVALVVIILIAIMIIRYRLTCRNLKKMKSSHGDSQSDVRFLTSDEVLNFNLAYVDD